MALIEDFESRFLLGVAAMDRNHREFVDLINRMGEASQATFVYLYPEMVRHTHAHFAAEEVMMDQSRFSATSEHRGEHQRVLGEMDWFGRHLQRGRIPLARAYVAEQLPGWFARHAVTMDSALAGHLNRPAPKPAQATLDPCEPGGE
ncbi:bacteriohemerythrin [Thiocystis violacea]|uniref:bacteriohemerythrin n=1 Tax=Thiocystis violacea TaxID=13725 RepID=UPI0019087A63|nr:hemerythrin domain-containing protein [Thiocystis violacea]MBK1716127.1 hemerythrin [Thiocystis violacea]